MNEKKDINEIPERDLNNKLPENEEFERGNMEMSFYSPILFCEFIIKQ